MSKNADALADIIRARAGAEPVALGLILGSGLGHLAAAVDGVAIPYSDLPGCTRQLPASALFSRSMTATGVGSTPRRRPTYALV